MPDIIEIENVPHSPNTSFDIIWVYNPLNRNFIFRHAGLPYVIPAKSRKQFPEFLGRHLAKHLAKLICIHNHEAEVAADAIMVKSKGGTPDMAKSMPLGRFDLMFKWILDSGKICPEEVTEEIVQTFSEEDKREYKDKDFLDESGLAKSTPKSETKSEPKTEQETEIKEDVKEEVKEEEGFKCEVCGKVCKSKLGLISHSRKHK